MLNLYSSNIYKRNMLKWVAWVVGLRPIVRFLDLGQHGSFLRGLSKGIKPLIKIHSKIIRAFEIIRVKINVPNAVLQNYFFFFVNS